MSQLPTPPSPLSFTPEALNRITIALSSSGVPKDWKVRVGIRGGGCGVMGYILGFDEQKETDAMYNVQNLEVIVDKRHSMYILGMLIDYHEDEHQAGFVFNNPSAEKENIEG